MEGSYNYHGEVYLEIVDKEQLTLGKRQDEHPNELGDSDTTQNLPKTKLNVLVFNKIYQTYNIPHVIQSRLSPFNTRLPFTRYEPVYNVG